MERVKTWGEAWNQVLAPLAPDARILWLGAPAPRAYAERSDSISQLGSRTESDTELPRYGAIICGPTRDELWPTWQRLSGLAQPEALMACWAPTICEGGPSLWQRMANRVDASRVPRRLEDISAAMLSVGASPIRALRVAGLRGDIVVFGRLHPLARLGQSVQ